MGTTKLTEQQLKEIGGRISKELADSLSKVKRADFDLESSVLILTKDIKLKDILIKSKKDIQKAFKGYFKLRKEPIVLITVSPFYDIEYEKKSTDIDNVAEENGKSICFKCANCNNATQMSDGYAVLVCVACWSDCFHS